MYWYDRLRSKECQSEGIVQFSKPEKLFLWIESMLFKIKMWFKKDTLGGFWE